MICPIQEENERLKTEIKEMKKEHSKDIEKIREMLINKVNKKS